MIQFIRDLLCSHDDEVINQFETKSEVEQLKSLGITPNTYNDTEKKYITDYKCNVCGRIKRLIIEGY